MYILARIVFAIVVTCGIASSSAAQNKNFTPVEGASLKAKIDAAVAQGRANAPGGRFWVGYQFEVRSGVAIDFEIVDSNGSISMSNGFAMKTREASSVSRIAS